MASGVLMRDALKRPDAVRRGTRDRQTMQRVIIKQGYLKKMPNMTRLGSSFKKVESKWFIFGIMGQADPYLEYYENEESIFGRKPLNIFFLDTCYNIARNQKIGRFSNIFTLALKDRMLSLVASNRGIMLEWCRAIEEKLYNLGIIEMSHGDNDYIRLPDLQRHSVHAMEIAEFQEEDQTSFANGNSEISPRQPLEIGTSVSDGNGNQTEGVNTTVGRGVEDTCDMSIVRIEEDDQEEKDEEEQNMVYINVSSSAEAHADGTYMRFVQSSTDSISAMHLNQSGHDAMLASPYAVLNGATRSTAPTALPSPPSEMMQNVYPTSISLCLPSYDEAMSDGTVCPNHTNSQFSSVSSPPSNSQSTRSLYIPGQTNSYSGSGFAPPPYSSSARVLMKGANMPLKQIQVQKLIEEMNEPQGVQVILPKNQCRHSIALTECFDKIWISGWNQRTCPAFHSFLHIGDELVSICGTAVNNLRIAKKMLKGCAGKMDAVLTIKRIPFGRVFAIRRENGSSDSLGISLINGTAEIGYIDPAGLALRNGLEEKAPGIGGTGNGSWWITEVNHQPLNLFFKDDEVKQRLNAFGNHLSFVVQPAQLIIEMKKQLKNLKNCRDFLVY